MRHTRRCTLMWSKRGFTLAPYTLIELVLAALVIVVLYFAMVSLVDGADFYQQFFSKDNAMLAESVHAVPNGNMHLGYLWMNPDFRIAVGDRSVGVQIVKKGIPANRRDKAFGPSKQVAVNGQSFAPKSFEWSVQSGTPRVIAVDQTFRIEDRCPASTAPLSGLIITARADGFDPATADHATQDTYERIRAAVSANGDTFEESGPLVVLFAVQADAEQQLAVFSSAQTELGKRLSCLVAAEVGVPVQPVAARPNSAPEGDIVIVARGRNPSIFNVASDILKQATLSYRQEAAHG